MARIIGRDIGPELCKVLGIPYENVKSFILTVEANDVVTVDTRIYVDEKELGKIKRIIGRYEMHTKEGG